MSSIILGIDRQEQISNLVAKKRVALVTNFSGIDSNFNTNYSQLLKNGCNIVKFMTPEHGFYVAKEGETIQNSTHRETGLLIVSLYGAKKQPSEEDFSDIDAVIYDIQDVGLRYFTYIYTLAYIIKACSKYNKQLVVLDRPNPLGCDKIIGSKIADNNNSFVGGYRLPLQYGMTTGEIGNYFIDFLNLNIDYSVVKMKSYKRDMTFKNSASPWNIPSPALPDYDALLCYCGGCFFEATNISEGRGTPTPFRFFGAPFVESEKLINMLRTKEFLNCGFAFRERSFSPNTSKHEGIVCHGVEVFPIDDNKSFFPIAIELMKLFKELYPNDFSFTKFTEVARLTSLSGDDRITDYINGSLDSLDEMYFDWEQESLSFYEQTKKFYLY